MRGEGTRAAVSRSTAVFKTWRSCTILFHHGDIEKNEHERIEKKGHRSRKKRQRRKLVCYHDTNGRSKVILCPALANASSILLKKIIADSHISYFPINLMTSALFRDFG